MKKFLSVVLAAALMFTIIVPSTGFAKSGPSIKLSDAIEIAKKALEITTDNYNFNYSYNDNNNGKATWELYWNSKSATGGSMNVSIDSEKGDIINYYSWENYSGPVTKIPKFSKDKALEAAAQFIKKLQPTKFTEMVFKEPVSVNGMPIYSDTYNFNFIRIVNGIEFGDNGVNIALDKNTLKVRNYNFIWDDGTFTDPAKAILPDNAKKSFENNLGLGLSYNIITDQKNKKQNAVLVYALKNGINCIDAVTGEVINNAYGGMFGGGMGAYADKTAAASSGPALTPEEQKSADASSSYISKEKAIEEAQKYLAVDSGTKPTYSSLYVNSFDNSATWNLSWDINDNINKTYSYMSAQIDAVTGKIKSFSMGGDSFYPKDNSPVKYTTEQAIQIAEKFISSLEPDKFKLVKINDFNNQFIPKPAKITDYAFNYVGFINNAQCSFDNFNISVNAYTGKVMNYYMNWNDTIKLPTSDKAMSLEDAYKNFYSKSKLALKYIRYYNYNQPGIPKPEIKLAYVVDNFYYGMFDAVTGVYLDYTGKPVSDIKTPALTDIKGNPAENDINILVDMGIIDTTDSKYNPGDVILQKDLIKLLVKSLLPGYVVYPLSDNNTKEDYDAYYETAFQKNILAKADKNPDMKITRQDAAKLIIRAMGIGYLGEMYNIYSSDFKDLKQIPDNYKGYAALAADLKIMDTINGNFEPGKEVTRGEAASLIVHYLSIDTSK